MWSRERNLAKRKRFPNRSLTDAGAFRGRCEDSAETGAERACTMAAPDVTSAPRAASSGALAGGKVRSDNLRPAKVDPERPFPTSRGVLSAAEIEALLRPDLPEPEPAPQRIDDRPVPDLEADMPGHALGPDQGERLAAGLSLAVRRASGLAMAFSLLELRRARFRHGLPAPETGTAYACFADEAGDIGAMLVLSPAISAAMTDALCGAAPELVGSARPRALTEIDADLIETALAEVAGRLPSGKLSLVCLESRAAFATALCPPGMANVLDLEVRLDGMTATARLVLAEALRAEEVPAPPASAPGQGADAAAAGGLTALLTARIASLAVPVSRVANLKPGDTLLLGLPADEPVQLLSGGRDGALVAEGQVGRKGRRMAVRISRCGPALR